MGRLSQVGKAAGLILLPVAGIIGANAVAGREAAALAAFAFFGIVGLALLAAAAGRVRAWLRLRGASATDPGEVDPGPVEIEGVARPLDGTVEPPRADDGAASLVYEHVVRKKQRGSGPDDPDTWRTTTDDTEGVPFVVEGDGGSVVVDPGGADLLLEASYEERGSARREYVRRLDAGETVYVAGEAVHATEYDGPTDGRQYAVGRPSTRVPESLRRLYDEPFVVSDSAEANAEKRLLRRGAKVSALALFYNVLYVGVLVAVAGNL